MTTSPREIFRPSRDERRVKLTQHFVGAIEELLAESSYSDLHVKAIIKAGGISPATFYSYYTDKADLLLAIVEQVQDDLGSVAFWKIPDEANKAEVRAALAAAAGIYAEHRWLMRALVEGAGYDASLRAAHTALVDRGVRNIAEHIKAGQRAGTVAPSLVAEDTARILAYAGEWWFYERLGTTGKKPNKAVVDALTEIFWRTLYEGCRPAG